MSIETLQTERQADAEVEVTRCGECGTEWERVETHRHEPRPAQHVLRL